MLSINDLMDLSNPFPQCFSIPKPIIYYIFKSSKIISSQKLMKSCKTFKCLHLKFNESQIKEFRIFQKSHKFDIESSCIKYGSNKFFDAELGYTPLSPHINFEIKSIKILDTLRLHYFHQDQFEMIIPKLDLSMTRQINISLLFQLKPDFMESLLQPSLENIYMQVLLPQIHVNPAVLTFQRCPNIREIVMHPSEVDAPEIITVKNFKEILKTKRTKKIVEGQLMKIVNIDPADMIKFMDNFVEEDGDFGFSFKEENLENYLKAINYIENVAKERKEKGIIPKSVIFVFCGRDSKWFKQML